ncbi:vitamin K-dependent protein Z isoform X4 [Manis pentadactyla]|uniref:vitamin K-dependent protein Z isoform X4 n=1 Tax=Manis pentadactyla TaxID=143292 RepID=UPI00255CACE2|nr:vitamin K-dependent protein Z isoform X4 [Manis pentadactyla]
MAPCVRLLFILLLFLEPHGAASSVFVPASDANEVLVRWKRAGSYLLEELFEGNLEKECYEEICVYEEAREVFENDADTDGFWKRYMGKWFPASPRGLFPLLPETSGSPCASRPCLNNGSCQDSVRSYICSCPSGYEGRDCALAKNECHAARTDGCQHFCRPGKKSYACSCAQGYRLGPDRKACVPHERCACGAPSPEGITAPLGGRRPLQAFPWQVKLTNSEGKDFCGGVVIQENFVLTTAKCSLLHRNISVKTSCVPVLQTCSRQPRGFVTAGVKPSPGNQHCLPQAAVAGSHCSTPQKAETGLSVWHCRALGPSEAWTLAHLGASAWEQLSHSPGSFLSTPTLSKQLHSTRRGWVRFSYETQSM